MTSAEGSPAGHSSEAALDEDAAPDTGLEPDTAGDAAGEDDATAPADQAHTPNAEPDRTVENPAGVTTGKEPAADSHPARAHPERAVLDGPALENDEMARATDDLQSSQDKSAAAKEIVADLIGKTQPTTTDR